VAERPVALPPASASMPDYAQSLDEIRAKFSAPSSPLRAPRRFVLLPKGLVTEPAKPCNLNFVRPAPAMRAGFPSGVTSHCRLGRGFLYENDLSAPTRRLASTGRDLLHAPGPERGVSFDLGQDRAHGTAHNEF
jgi:hypothetical protein